MARLRPGPPSVSSLVHAPLGWLQTAAFAVTGLLSGGFALGAVQVIGTSRRHRRTLLTGVLLLAAVPFMGWALGPGRPWFGLAERVWLLIPTDWLLSIAIRALRLPARATGADVRQAIATPFAASAASRAERACLADSGT